MKDINKVILVGRLGADPIRRSTQAGVVVVNFPLATSRRVKSILSDQTEDWRDETQWHNVVAWGRQGEVCSEHLRKGSSVYVEGSVRTRNYDSKEGVSKIAVEIHAEEVSFLGAAKKKPVVVEAASETLQ